MTVLLSLDGIPSVSGLSLALLILPLGYLVMAVLRRRALTWPVVIVGITLVVALRLQSVVNPAAVLVAISLVVLIVGMLHQSSRRDSNFHLQIVGLVVFSAAALVSMAVDPALATVIVAAGWLGHGIWDLVHLARKRVVAPSFAEWCGVFDIGVALQLLLLG
jgi:nicotinamide riboside transporter PnuC